MARSLNGTSDLIDVGTNSKIYGLTAMTFSGWINPSSLPGAYAAIIANNIAGGSPTTNWVYYIKSTGTLALYFTGGAVFDPGVTTLSTGTWYNVAFTSDGVSSSQGYVNAVSQAGSGGASNASVCDCNFGNDIRTAGRNFAGSIADFALWNIVLSTGELTALANGARPFTIRPKSIVGYWPLSGLQSPEPDLSGVATLANGTLTGTANASGPPVMQFTPRSPLIFPNAAAAAQTFQPAWAIRNRIVVEGIGI